MDFFLLIADFVLGSGESSIFISLGTNLGVNLQPCNLIVYSVDFFILQPGSTVVT